MMLRRLSLLASLAFAARHATPTSHATLATTISDSLRIFYIGRPAGWEHYKLEPSSGGMTLTSDYDYVDRGRRNHSQLTLTTGNDYSVKKYEAVRLTDTSRTVTTSIEFDGTHAKVTRA